MFETIDLDILMNEQEKLVGLSVVQNIYQREKVLSNVLLLQFVVT